MPAQGQGPVWRRVLRLGWRLRRRRSPRCSNASSAAFVVEPAARTRARRAVAPDDAMAGQDDRERIAPVRGADRPYGRRASDARRLLGVACGSRRRGSRRAPARQRPETRCREGRAARSNVVRRACEVPVRAGGGRLVKHAGRRPGVNVAPAEPGASHGSSPGQRIARSPVGRADERERSQRTVDRAGRERCRSDVCRHVVSNERRGRSVR